MARLCPLLRLVRSSAVVQQLLKVRVLVQQHSDHFHEIPPSEDVGVCPFFDLVRRSARFNLSLDIVSESFNFCFRHVHASLSRSEISPATMRDNQIGNAASLFQRSNSVAISWQIVQCGSESFAYFS